MYELVIVWSNGDRQTFAGYESREDAWAAEEGFYTAFGAQIAWSGVRPVYIPGEFNGYI